MAKLVVLVRHGKAQTRSADVADEERVLTDAGKRSLAAWLPRSARLLAEEGVTEAELWASPSKRTIQTAELVASALKREAGIRAAGVVEAPCLWSQDVDAFVREIRACSADAVVAVGHNPFCEDFAQAVCGSAVPFATGAVAAFRLDEEGDAGAGPAADAAFAVSGRLLWLVQGPESKRWKNVCDMEKVVRRASDAVGERLETFLANTDDVEAAHKVRVSIRTMRGLLSFVEPFQQRSQNKQMTRDLRDNVLCTSRLRELDVLSDQVAQLDPSAEDLLAACAEERARECERTVAQLTSKDAAKRFARVRKAARNLRWKDRVVQEGLGPDAVPARFAEVASGVDCDLATLDLADAEQTHDVRKRAKQVRYAAERFGGMIGAEAPATAARMEGVQDELGALCDARVNVGLVDAFPKEGLSEQAIWALGLLRAQNESYIYAALREARHEPADETRPVPEGEDETRPVPEGEAPDEMQGASQGEPGADGLAS